MTTKKRVPGVVPQWVLNLSPLSRWCGVMGLVLKIVSIVTGVVDVSSILFLFACFLLTLEASFLAEALNERRAIIGKFESALCGLIPWAGERPDGPPWAAPEAKARNREQFETAFRNACACFPEDYNGFLDELPTSSQMEKV